MCTVFASLKPSGTMLAVSDLMNMQSKTTSLGEAAVVHTAHAFTSQYYKHKFLPLWSSWIPRLSKASNERDSRLGWNHCSRLRRAKALSIFGNCILGDEGSQYSEPWPLPVTTTHHEPRAWRTQSTGDCLDRHKLVHMTPMHIVVIPLPLLCLWWDQSSHLTNKMVMLLTVQKSSIDANKFTSLEYERLK